MSLDLKEEKKLSVFENEILRKIFDPKEDGLVNGVNYIIWKLLNLYVHTDIIRTFKSRGERDMLHGWEME